jgi:DNA-directed RNA polymerase subunit RPC12/RpoP
MSKLPSKQLELIGPDAFVQGKFRYHCTHCGREVWVDPGELPDQVRLPDAICCETCTQWFQFIGPQIQQSQNQLGWNPGMQNAAPPVYKPEELENLGWSAVPTASVDPANVKVLASPDLAGTVEVGPRPSRRRILDWSKIVGWLRAILNWTRR